MMGPYEIRIKALELALEHASRAAATDIKTLAEMFYKFIVDIPVDEPKAQADA